MLKKILILTINLYFCICVFYPQVFANSFANEFEEKGEEIREIYKETGIEEILDRYADTEMLEEISSMFDRENLGSGLNSKERFKNLYFSPIQMINIITKTIKDEIKKPFRIMVNIIGVIIVLAAIKSLHMCFGGSEAEEIIRCICVLSVFVFISGPILDCVRDAVSEIGNMSDFMMSIVPVYAGLMSSCGYPVTGGLYNSFLFFVCQVFSQILSGRILSVMCIYMAFCLIGSISSNLNINESAKEIKNIITFILVFLVTIFVGLISVNGIVSCSVDTVETKAAKFLLGSSIPVIGSAISDAYSSMKGCFNFIRTGTGFVIIIFIVVSFLPIIIKLSLWSFIIKISAAISDFISIKPVASILRSCGYVMGLLIAIIVSYALMVVTSFTIVLILGLGVT